MINAFEKQVLEDLTEIKTKMDIVVGADGNGGRLADLEARMRSVESLKWRMTGIASVASAAAAGGVTWLLNHFR